MLGTSKLRTLSTASGLLGLMLSNAVTAIETQRNCAISLSNDQFVVLSGFQGSVMDVLANDSGDLDHSSLLPIGRTTAAGGTVFVVDGTIRYSPPFNFSGEDSFSYQVSEIDWRSDGFSVPLQLSDAGAPPSSTATGVPVIAAPSLAADTDWEAGTGLANETIFGRQLKFDADFTGCYQDSDPKFSIRLQWALTKRSGPTNPSTEFEASISPLANHPTASLASQSYAWPSSTSRQLNLDINALAGSQLDNFRAGLFAQARDGYGTYKWRSGGVQATASIDTKHCKLCTREALVTVTVDTDIDAEGFSECVEVDDENDGIPDLIEGRIDSDLDGVPNHQDLDSDNDGVPDLIEAGGTNSDGNGRLADSQDNDGDGWNDLAQSSLQPERDTDGDGVLDFLDLDSDNDGTPDVVEQGQLDRAPRDGRVDSFRDANGDGLHDVNISIAQARDTDNDGIADMVDLDSDGDRSFDTLENELDDFDNDRDGMLDALQDSNGNGVIDAVDAALTGGLDLNQNGIDDAYDALVQLGGDLDRDGISDNSDPDANGDGWHDAVVQMAAIDRNDDGTADYLQADYATNPVAFNGTITDDISDDNSVLAGVDGYGGCSLNPRDEFDPILLLIGLISLLYLTRRRLQRCIFGTAHDC